MSQESQQTQLFITSNRKTPSTKRHINSLPPEILCHIFGCYCSRRYGPLPLLLVCRLWHAIASNCSALWGNIYLDAFHHRPTEKSNSEMDVRQNRIFCYTWANFQWAVKRAGTAPLNLSFDSVDTHGLLQRQGSDILFFTRCRELSLLPLETPVGFLNNLPALEHLGFHPYGKTEGDQLFNGIEQGSPLLWSLTLRDMRSLACLVHLPTLLRRIRRLDIYFNTGEYIDQFMMGLQNLTELTVHSHRNLQFPRLNFPKLLSLTIWNTRLGSDEKTELPVLDRLTLHEKWSNLPLIVAPRLTKLILRCEKRPNTLQTAILLHATVRPTSLVLSDASMVTNLPELLTMWSGLLDLHLGYCYEVNVMSQVSLATLGGNSEHGRLCPHLRYLTVHMTQKRAPRVTGQVVQTLRTIVEERKRYDTDELRRVMCVRGWHNQHPDTSDEIEWVDVL